MIIALYILFWGAVLLLFHSYLFYPLILKVLARNKKDNAITFERKDDLPLVHIVMAVYNEEQVIAQKLHSIFLTNYPIDKIKVLIGSDNSTDETNAIIESYAVRYPQISFHNFEDRNGKSGVLNRLRTFISTNEIVILTDANVLFTPDCIFEMVKHFKNEEIAQVAANIVNKGMNANGISKQEKTYIQRENLIKYREGKIWGTMQGAFGACYALRASYFAAIPKNFLMEDFYLSMHVLANNKKAISALNAICYEDVSNEINEEFKRKTRISAGNFQNLSVYGWLLKRWDANAFCFFSHKVIRWFGPFLMMLLYVTNFFLSLDSICYRYLFMMQNVMLFVLPFLDFLLKKANIHLSILRFVSYFYAMNLALLVGFWKYMEGVQNAAWKPTKRENI
jgi:cellulose synthase/poly-beta-1,6-N-acetylglucosamine synthase-like glycosyltransferase